MKLVYLLFAGANGSGKSTCFNSLNWQSFIDIPNYKKINPDETLRELGLNATNKSDQLKAAKTCIKKLNNCLQKKESIIQETTLCGKSILRKIVDAKNAGYDVDIIYIGVDNFEICKERIAHRVKTGGHFIDNETVERRYNKSIQNLSKALKGIGRAILIDNSIEYAPLMAITKQNIDYFNNNVNKHPWVVKALGETIA